MSDAKSIELRKKICSGEVNPNSQELYFGVLVKAVLGWLEEHITLRGERIPHRIISTGDDTVYRYLQHYIYSYNPVDQSGEDYVINQIPRCICDFDGFSVDTSQLTSPYSRGYFDIDWDGTTYGMTAEFRRLPVSVDMHCKYYMDSFTDTLAVTQMLAVTMMFTQNIQFAYMGQTIAACMSSPTDINHEKNLDVDFDTENRQRSISFDVNVTTNMPVYDYRTAIEADCTVSAIKNNITVPVAQTTTQIIK